MGTVATCGDRARVKIRDTGENQFTDAQLLGIMNDILKDIYQTLVNVSSNLVYTSGDITTVDGTGEYTPSFTHNGFLRDGSWVDGEDIPLKQVGESSKIEWDYGTSTSQPEAFYVTEDNKVGYLWVPDDVYTIHHMYWKPVTTLTDYDNDTLPWDSIWNQAIQRALVVETLEILELDNSRQAILAESEWDKAMSMTYARGVRQERVISNMFTVEGI